MNGFSYSSREGALAPAQKFSVNTGGLHILELTGSDQENCLILPWTAILSVDLLSAANRYAPSRRVCVLHLNTGRKIKIFSAAYHGFAYFKNQASDFNYFVVKLHRYLHHFSPDCRFGQSLPAYTRALRYLSVSGLVLVLLALIVFLSLAGISGWFTLVKLLLIVSLLPALWSWLQEGFSACYDPLSIPEKFLAKE